MDMDMDMDMVRAFDAMRTHARQTGRPLLKVATQVIEGTLDEATLIQH